MTDAIYTITEVPQSDSNYNITCFGQSAYGKAMLTTTCKYLFWNSCLKLFQFLIWAHFIFQHDLLNELAWNLC